MAEKDKIFSSKVKYGGVFSFSDFYRFCYDWLTDETQLDISEDKYVEKLQGNAKNVDVIWTGTRKVTDYFKFSIKYNDNLKPLGEGIIKKPAKEVKNNTLTIALVHPNFNFENQGKLIFYFDFLDENNKIIETVTPEYELIVEEKVLDS